MKQINLHTNSWLPKLLASKVNQRVQEVLAEIYKLPISYSAVVLGGGWKNQEITLSSNEIKTDIDLYLFSNFLPLWCNHIKQIEKNINYRQSIVVDLHIVAPWWLRKSRTLWAYKLKHEAIVLDGNHKILDKIQASSNNIPKTEAIRVLFETLINRLMALEIKSNQSDTENYQIAIAKAYLAIGESYLIIKQRLTPSYQQRMNEFKDMSKNLNLSQEIIKRVLIGYQVKVNYPLVKETMLQGYFNLHKAKLDCLETIQDNFNELSQAFTVNIPLNSIFYFRLRTISGLKLKFWPIITKFKISDIYQMAFYYETSDKTKLNNIFVKFFGSTSPITKDLLVNLLQLWPTPPTREIN